MENYIPIAEKLEQMSHEGISKRKKNPVFGTVLMVAGIALCILGTQPMEAPDWLKLFLIVAGISVFIFAVIRLFVDLHSNQYYYEPSRQPIRKSMLYISSEYKSEIVDIIKNSSFQKLKNIKKTYSSGIVLTVMYTCDGTFCMLQAQEYSQNEFVPTTEAVVVDEDGKQLVMEFLRSPIA